MVNTNDTPLLIHGFWLVEVMLLTANNGKKGEFMLETGEEERERVQTHSTFALLLHLPWIWMQVLCVQESIHLTPLAALCHTVSSYTDDDDWQSTWASAMLNQHARLLEKLQSGSSLGVCGKEASPIFLMKGWNLMQFLILIIHSIAAPIVSSWCEFVLSCSDPPAIISFVHFEVCLASRLCSLWYYHVIFSLMMAYTRALLPHNMHAVIGHQDSTHKEETGSHLFSLGRKEGKERKS